MQLIAFLSTCILHTAHKNLVFFHFSTVCSNESFPYARNPTGFILEINYHDSYPEKWATLLLLTSSLEYVGFRRVIFLTKFLRFKCEYWVARKLACVYHRQVRAARGLSWLAGWQNRRDSMYLCWHVAGPELGTPKELPNQNWLCFDQLTPRKMSAATGIYVPFI